MSELKKIMHVDDDEDILEIAKMALEMVDGFELHQFNSGAAALDAFETVAPQLMLLDVMMPGMTGPELSRNVRERHAALNTPFIFMTAKAEQSVCQELYAAGALEVITKPFDPMSLGSQIRDAWSKR
ncbi:response regulator [Marivita geojedonensis]|uniref:Response regulatory domain-containing protein n=1 Tax=Marivita geojedonensis TaxID=1123756 RepID=A0A1X4NH72_9RHOB|nr:response regulator [Marivita geojedonensis]OSQ46599.1 hypothetical protein MGEO_17285 [Marivita geojedonensis]PRY74197.1 response regulator receiver domain-containing protein [Marivita geojedonensis]